MTLQEAIKSGKNFRREGDIWLQTVGGDIDAVDAMQMYTINNGDILATDWELEEDKPNVIYVLDTTGTKVCFGWSMDNEFIIDGTNEFTQESLDKILTFLYNNTKIGKSRITPF